MPDTLASLRGPVSCRRGAAPLGLTLVGETSEHPGERTELAFSAAAPRAVSTALIRFAAAASQGPRLPPCARPAAGLQELREPTSRIWPSRSGWRRAPRSNA